MHSSSNAWLTSKKRGVSIFSLAAGLMLASACGTGADDQAVAGDAVDEAGDESLPNVLAQEVPGESSCLANITNYGARGPFRTTSRTVGRVKMIIPTVPAGCKVPVAHIANGTGASCGIYASIGETLATHGFLTTCYENTNTGAGDQGITAFDTALQNYPNLAAKSFASLGHSQGGQAAFTVLALAEAKYGTDSKYAGLAMEPASGFGTQPRGGSWQSVYARIRSPMFMFSGTADILVSESWVRRGFDALNNNVEAYHWSASGATHIPTPNRETSEIAIPWFRWKLLGDQNACRAFQALERGSRWRQVQVQNAVQCQ